MVKNIYDNCDGEITKITFDKYEYLFDKPGDILCDMVINNKNLSVICTQEYIYFVDDQDTNGLMECKTISITDVTEYLPVDIQKFKNMLMTYDNLYMMECEYSANESINLEEHIYGPYNCYYLGDYKIYIFEKHVYVFKNDLYLFDYDAEEITYEYTGWLKHSWELFKKEIQDAAEYCEDGEILKNNINKNYNE